MSHFKCPNIRIFLCIFLIRSTVIYTIEEYKYDPPTLSLQYLGIVTIIHCSLLAVASVSSRPDVSGIERVFQMEHAPEFTQALIDVLQDVISRYPMYRTIFPSLDFVRKLPPTKENIPTMEKYEQLYRIVYPNDSSVDLMLIHGLLSDSTLQKNAFVRLERIIPSTIVSAISFILELPWKAINRKSYLPLAVWILLDVIKKKTSHRVIELLQELVFVDRALCEK